MKRILVGAVVALILLASVGAIWIYTELHTLEVERVTDDVHMISGLTGNVGVLATERGAVVVDTMLLLSQARQVRELSEDVGRGPIQAIINTHYHGDHTHGNPAFPSGVKIVATRKTRDYLLHFDGAYWDGEAQGSVPNDVFEDEHTLRIGGKTLRSHYLGRGHTGGDLVVLFVEDRVLHAGDLFFNGRYPRIDLEGGGSVQQWGDTLDRVLELPFDKVIPGHGPVGNREDLLAFRRFIRELAVEAGEVADLTLEEALERVKLTADEGLRAVNIPFVVRFDRDLVVRRAWEEASGTVNPETVPGGTREE